MKRAEMIDTNKEGLSLAPRVAPTQAGPVRLLCVDYDALSLNPRAKDPATADHVDYAWDHGTTERAADFVASYRRLVGAVFPTNSVGFAYTRYLDQPDQVTAPGPDSAKVLPPPGLAPGRHDVVAWSAAADPIELLDKRGWFDGAVRLYLLGVSTELVIHLARQAAKLIDVHLIDDCSVSRSPAQHSEIISRATDACWVRDSTQAYEELRRHLSALTGRRF